MTVQCIDKISKLNHADIISGFLLLPPSFSLFFVARLLAFRYIFQPRKMYQFCKYSWHHNSGVKVSEIRHLWDLNPCAQSAIDF